jgi:stage V sporulation protein R
VHLQTVVDNQPSLLSFDGSAHTMKTLGDNDDANKKPPAKTR